MPRAAPPDVRNGCPADATLVPRQASDRHRSDRRSLRVHHITMLKLLYHWRLRVLVPKRSEKAMLALRLADIDFARGSIVLPGGTTKSKHTRWPCATSSAQGADVSAAK